MPKFLFEELGGVQPNPVDEKVYEGIELAKKSDIDSVLAIGGGSSIDTAKAIAAALPTKAISGISTAAKQK